MGQETSVFCDFNFESVTLLSVFCYRWRDNIFLYSNLSPHILAGLESMTICSELTTVMIRDNCQGTFVLQKQASMEG